MYFKKNDLEDLLNTLSTAEIRQFFQYLKSLNNKETPIYLKLFVQQKSAPSQHSEKIPLQTNTKAKKRLYNHLIQSLRQYHQEKSTEIIIQNLLSEIEILYDRGLIDQSLILLKKAYRKAVANENFGLILQTLAWERKLNITLDKPDRPNFEIAEEEKNILNNLNHIIELENIYGKVKEIKKRHGYVKGTIKQELEKITVKNPYLLDQYRPDTQRGKYYFHFIHSMYYVMVFDTKRAYQYSKELLAPQIQQVLPNEYIEGVLEHVTSCLGLGYFDEMLKALHLADTFVLEKRFNHSTFFLVRTFYFRICYTLIMYTYMGNLVMLLSTIKEAEEKLLTYDKQLSSEMKLVIYGNLRNAYIASGAYDQAEKLLKIMLQKESRFLRSDVYNDLFLSRVFSFLASKTYVLVPSMALSAHRQYTKVKSNETLFEVGLKITSILMKENDFEIEKEKKAVLFKIKNILEQHIESLHGLNNFQEIYSFYIIWTDSILEDQPFHITAAKWYQRHIDNLQKFTFKKNK